MALSPQKAKGIVSPEVLQLATKIEAEWDKNIPTEFAKHNYQHVFLYWPAGLDFTLKAILRAVLTKKYESAGWKVEYEYDTQRDPAYFKLTPRKE